MSVEEFNGWFVGVAPPIPHVSPAEITICCQREYYCNNSTSSLILHVVTTDMS